MQIHYISHLASTQHFNLVKRALSRRTLPVLRQLIQADSLQTTASLRLSCLLRYTSTNSSNDEQTRNEEKKKTMTNLMYIVGGLTGVIAIYSIFQNRNNSKEKQPSVAEYDSRHIKSKDSDESNKTPDEKDTNMEEQKSIVEQEDSDSVETIKKNDLTSNIPNFAQYLIIGGGATAMSAFKSIRAHDPTAKVLVISSEKYLPYMRPPLSKDIWYTDDDDLIQKHSFKQWHGKEKSLYFFDDEFYTDVKTLNDQENGGVAVVLGRKVVDLDLKKSIAKLDNDWEVSFEKCLIATGGQPKTLKIFQDVSNHLKIMLNNQTLNSADFPSEHSSKLSSQKIYLSDTKYIFPNSLTNMTMHNNIAEKLDLSLNNNSNPYSVEYELILNWLNVYQSSSLFITITYGILSIISSKQIPNAIEIIWDTSSTTSLFIRFKCTSTDFAQKRHGGETGIPLRIQVDTYENNIDSNKHLHSCCCKIQLFHLKGAQRKNKADKMRIGKLNYDQHRHYQTALEDAILQSGPISTLYTLNLLSLSYRPDDLFDACTVSTIEENSLIKKQVDDDFEIENKDNDCSESLSSILSLSSSNIKYNSKQCQNYQAKLETKITMRSSINRFQYYTGVDLLRLTKNDIRQICNGDDAISIRLHKQLNETIIQSLKILYITLTNSDIYSTIDDFFTLKNIVDSGANVAIVGGGFLGSELACALAYRSKENAKNGKPSGKIIQLMFEKGNISKVLPEYLSKWTSDRVREEGAEVVTNIELVDASLQEGKISLSYIDPKEPRKTSYVTTDHVIVAVGIEPNTDLAESAGLEIDPDQGGFLVNAELQARHNIWVAGDAASFYDIKLGRRRVEHYDHAIVSGKLAGENMTGAHNPYWHQSMFWSDLGPNIGFEAIGLTDSGLQTVAVYAKGKFNDEGQKGDSDGNREQKDAVPISNSNVLKEKTSETRPTTDNKNAYNKGVVFYLKDNRVVGVVLWNIFNRIPIARKIIKDQQVITDFQELAKLFNIHQD
ncbi:unnamed protein product [Rotaria magnacalcarata]|uniref:Grh/CP2 DB domain-containing protein n=1 Tax=Rotaria magnacalcarata TaxID=392030 RepID=A0A816WH97_9BILA|nr:unnamed protein product [Rotaria magnacalcarata]